MCTICIKLQLSARPLCRLIGDTGCKTQQYSHGSIQYMHGVARALKSTVGKALHKLH